VNDLTHKKIKRLNLWTVQEDKWV